MERESELEGGNMRVLGVSIRSKYIFKRGGAVIFPSSITHIPELNQTEER